MVPIEDTLSMRLRRAFLAMHRRAQAEFSAQGATVSQYIALTVLAEDDALTQGELAERSNSDANTIAAMLNLLEGRGLVRRRVDARDGRARRVYLTPQGRRLSQLLAARVEPLHRRINAALEPAERETLLRCLPKIAEAMSSADGGKAPRARPKEAQPKGALPNKSSA